MSITGEPDGEPQKVGVAVVDVLAGLFATVGILAALSHRDAPARDSASRSTCSASLLAALVNQASAFTAAGVVAHGWETRTRASRRTSSYATGDGQLVVAVGNDRQFQALCEVLGAPELAQDATATRRTLRESSNHDALRVELEDCSPHARRRSGPRC